MTAGLSASALSVFPEYGALHAMFAREVEGLPEALIEKRRPGKSWGEWSIREQVSHSAWIFYLFFLNLCAGTLFPGGLPRDKSLADTGGADRMLDPARFPAIADAMDALEDGCAIAREVLGRETVGSLREKTVPRPIPGDRRWANGERVADYFENLVLPAHPDGFRLDENNPELYHQSLESVFRHILWEAYVHLKTIQEHKKAEGLTPVVDVPEVGYIPMLEWE